MITYTDTILLFFIALLLVVVVVRVNQLFKRFVLALQDPTKPQQEMKSK